MNLSIKKISILLLIITNFLFIGCHNKDSCFLCEGKGELPCAVCEKGHLELNKCQFCDENGNYEIHDYKSGKRIMSQKDADNNDQLAMYQIALEKEYKNIKSIKLIWHFLQFNQEVSSIRTPSQIEELVQTIKTKINEIRNHIFDKKPFRANESILCNWCYYWEECPAKSTPNPYI